jgi:hypothetical protein
MNGYSLVLASDVLERDGMGLELYDLSNQRIAEIFLDDETGERTFTSYRPLEIKQAVLRWFLNESDELL